MKGTRKLYVAGAAVLIGIGVDMLTTKGLSPNLLDLIKYVVCGFFAGNAIEHYSRKDQYSHEALYHGVNQLPASPDAAPVVQEESAPEQSENTSLNTPDEEAPLAQPPQPQQVDQSQLIARIAAEYQKALGQLDKTLGVIGQQLQLISQQTAASNEGLMSVTQGMRYVVDYINLNNKPTE